MFKAAWNMKKSMECEWSIQKIKVIEYMKKESQQLQPKYVYNWWININSK